MICMAFFVSMRPGEYTYSRQNTPFRVQDVRLFIGNIVLDPLAATNQGLAEASSVALTLTTQKNGVKGAVITHGRRGNPLTCPVQAMVRRFLHFRQHSKPPSTPLCQLVNTNGTVKRVTSNEVKQARLSYVGPDTLGIQPHDMDARSLRAGDATTLCRPLHHPARRSLEIRRHDSLSAHLG